MRKLIEQINYHDNLYYKKNYQVISDQEYDELRKDLVELELKYPEEKINNSPNKKVGKLDSQNFKTIKHKSPMLSLNNAYEKNEVKNFYNKTYDLLKKNFKVLAETKVDGLSASLRYEGRVLKIGLTRGDGVKGEDITRNLSILRELKKNYLKIFQKI